MDIRSRGRFIRFSARKGRDVARLIRGKDVEQARNTLSFTNKSAARALNKVLNSALSNARQREGVDVDNLFVKTVMVDEGPTLKRFRARAMGRGNRINKRTCHITVVLDERTA
ncbi:MAG: 50S ribosomal protein L22 [Candidatus Alcyoniella australis]|nr:50S ribosomal protein L22 [Candidatus Alcyoniella australis]